MSLAAVFAREHAGNQQGECCDRWEEQNQKICFSFLLSSFQFLLSPTLFYLTFCFSSLPLLEAICFPLPVLFGLQMPLYRNTLVGASMCLTYVERMYLGWAQPGALKGMVRAWHTEFHKFWVPIQETQKGNIILPPGSELLKTWFCTFYMTSY